MRHFESNCKDILKKISIQGSAKHTMLDVVFGENGLVEADSKKDVKSKMKESVKLLTEIETEFLKQKPSQEYGQFALYIAEREKTVLRKMTKDVRRNAFRVKDMQNPPRIYTNQSEAVNWILSSKKVALGYSKKEDVSKTIFIKEIWKPAVDHQHFEMEKAVINQSSEYRLSQEAAYLSVPIELWYTWSKIRRNKYINYTRNLNKRLLKKICGMTKVICPL